MMVNFNKKFELRLLSIMIPIRILALLGFMNMSLLRRLFPNFVFEKSFLLENFYDIDLSQPDHRDILTKASLSVFLCYRLMDNRAGDLSLSQRLKSKLIRFMMQRVIFSRRFDRSLDFCSRILRPIPFHLNFGVNQGYTSSIVFHELFPIMAVCARSCHIFQIQGDFSSFNEVSIVDAGNCNSFLSACFHRSLPILALGRHSGIITICTMNLDGTNVTVVFTIPVNQGSIWSLVFHPTLPILFVSTQQTGNVVILHFTEDFRSLKFDAISAPVHLNTINSIQIQKDIRFLLTVSDDCRAIISTFSSDFRELNAQSVLGHRHNVLSCAIHPFFPLVATGSDDMLAKIWNVSNLKNPQFIRRLLHPAGVRSLLFCSGFTLFTGNYNGSVRLWNIECLGEEPVQPDAPIQPVFEISGQNSVLSIGFTPNNPTVVVVGDSRQFTSHQLE
jgi:WD40 repeat protein